MKYKISLCISALCFFTAFLILMAYRTTGEEALASRIAPEILRFHVLAESDSARDQNLEAGCKGTGPGLHPQPGTRGHGQRTA